MAAIGGYGMGDTISYLNGVYHSKSINGSNKSRLNNPEIDAMIDQASATIDQAQREALTEQICAKLNEICTQAASVPAPDSMRAFNADLEGCKGTSQQLAIAVLRISAGTKEPIAILSN